MIVGTRLKDQVAWISGAASGMGEATARLFAHEGAAVVVVDKQAARGASIAKEIVSGGGRAIFVECDVSCEKSVASSIERTVREFGGPQSIVNCAGIVQLKPLHEIDETDWDRLMDTNVKSMFLSIKHGFEHLKKNSRSYVINIGSVGSFIGQSSTPAYTASKGAVMMLSKSIALDYAAYGVRCNCVSPGDHRHADAARAPQYDTRCGCHIAYPFNPRSDWRAPDSTPNRQSRALFFLRRLCRHHRDVRSLSMVATLQQPNGIILGGPGFWNPNKLVELNNAARRPGICSLREN